MTHKNQIYTFKIEPTEWVLKESPMNPHTADTIDIFRHYDQIKRGDSDSDPEKMEESFSVGKWSHQLQRDGAWFRLGIVDYARHCGFDQTERRWKTLAEAISAAETRYKWDCECRNCEHFKVNQKYRGVIAMDACKVCSIQISRLKTAPAEKAP